MGRVVKLDRSDYRRVLPADHEVERHPTLGNSGLRIPFAPSLFLRPVEQKMNLVSDIDTIQSQLAKPEPNRGIVKAACETVKGAATIDGCVSLVQKTAGLIATIL